MASRKVSADHGSRGVCAAACDDEGPVEGSSAGAKKPMPPTPSTRVVFPGAVPCHDCSAFSRP